MNAPTLWSVAEAAAATNGHGQGNWQVSGVSTDSRTVQQGDLFVAIQGPKFNGHRFAADALERGAAAVMVHEQPNDLAPDAPVLMVANTMAGLEALGVAARTRTAAKIAAVTGSVGKTGTKEALLRVLASVAPTHASQGNLNNHWGVPLSLSRMPADSVYGVFELGMNHAGEITPLSQMVRPHVAIITNVELVHLEFFASLCKIADAKAEVFAGLQPGGIAILNRDDTYFTHLETAAKAAGAGRIISFGAHEAAEVRLIELAQHPTCNCIFADIDGQAVTYKIGAPGRHWAINSLAVLAAVRALSADLGLAALAMADVSPTGGRGARHRVDYGDGSILIIDESYNASPVAVAAAIETLGAVEPARLGRRIAVLGDMLEMGPASPDLHADLAPALVSAGADLVFACGPWMANLFEALPGHMRGRYESTSADLLPRVIAAVQAGDTVLVKGSLGIGMAPIVRALLELGPDSNANTSAVRG